MSNAALYIIAILIWGSTWLAIEFQLGVVAPEVSVFYRYAAAAALLFAWSAVKGRRMRFDRRAHAWFAVLGLLLFQRRNDVATPVPGLPLRIAVGAEMFQTHLRIDDLQFIPRSMHQNLSQTANIVVATPALPPDLLLLIRRFESGFRMRRKRFYRHVVSVFELADGGHSTPPISKTESAILSQTEIWSMIVIAV